MLVTGLKEAVDYARGKSPALVAKYEDGKLVCRKRKMADGTEVSGYQPWKVAIWIMKIMAREKKWVKSWSRAKKKARAPLKNKTTRVLCYHSQRSSQPIAVRLRLRFSGSCSCGQCFPISCALYACFLDTTPIRPCIFALYNFMYYLARILDIKRLNCTYSLHYLL